MPGGMRRGATAAPRLGVSFSHRHAAWLGLDPRESLRSLLSGTGVRYLRLSAYWDEIAPEANKLDFAPLRRWLDIAAEYDARVLMTVGIKGQRWPEFYPPEWLTRAHTIPPNAALDDHPRVVALLLLMLERLVAYLADQDVIDSWQVENEPFVPASSAPDGWRISPGLLDREIAVTRDADPRRRPIVVNHSSHSRFDGSWQSALRPADVLAQNVYTRQPAKWRWWPGRYLDVHALGPLSPPLYAQAETARREGGDFWITELQAEPWERQPVTDLAPDAVRSISPALLRHNLRLARRTGASRVYLWGAEWWQYTAQKHGDRRYLELARELFGGGKIT